MKKTIWYGLLAALIGCVPSIHAFYTDKDVVYDPALVGTWYSTDGGDHSPLAQTKLVFIGTPADKSYELVYTDNKAKKGDFQIHLLNLNGTRFLDFYPDGDSITQSDFYKGHLVPAHSLFRVDVTASKLILGDMDIDWMNKYLKANPTALAHESTGASSNDDSFVLTASTSDLQQFVLAHMNDDGFFKPNTFTHDKPAASQP